MTPYNLVHQKMEAVRSSKMLETTQCYNPENHSMNVYSWHKYSETSIHYFGRGSEKETMDPRKQ
jgi:hypothetical protein